MRTKRKVFRQLPHDGAHNHIHAFVISRFRLSAKLREIKTAQIISRFTVYIVQIDNVTLPALTIAVGQWLGCMYIELEGVGSSPGTEVKKVFLTRLRKDVFKMYSYT